MLWIFNLAAADVCFMAYVGYGIKTGDWSRGLVRGGSVRVKPVCRSISERMIK